MNPDRVPKTRSVPTISLTLLRFIVFSSLYLCSDVLTFSAAQLQDCLTNLRTYLPPSHPWVSAESSSTRSFTAQQNRMIFYAARAVAYDWNFNNCAVCTPVLRIRTQMRPYTSLLRLLNLISKNRTTLGYADAPFIHFVLLYFRLTPIHRTSKNSENKI